MKKRHVVLATGLILLASISFAGVSLDSLTPDQGPLGESWSATLSGSGFDDQLYLSAYPDSTPNIQSEYTLRLGGRTYGVAVSNDTAYIGTNIGDIHVVDVSDPTRPHRIGVIHGLLHCWELEISGNYLYVATTGRNQTSYEWENRLSVVDISIPRQPRIIGSVETDECVDIAVAGHMVYLAGSTVQVVDASQPDAPVVVGSIDTPLEAQCIAVSGDRLVVDGGTNSIYCIDVSDPHSPRLIGSLSNDDFNRPPEDFAVSDGYILVTGWKDLMVLDVHGSAPISEVGRVPVGDGLTHKISVSDDVACVTEYDNSIYIFDIADPRQPKLLGHILQPIQFNTMTSSGRYVYATASDDLKIIDIDAMSPVGTFDYVFTRLSNWAIAAHAGKIYCAGSTLYVIDAATQKVEYFILLDPHYVSKLFVSDDQIIADSTGGIIVFDNTVPERPVFSHFSSFEKIETTWLHPQRVVTPEGFIHVLDGDMLKTLSIQNMDGWATVVGELQMPGVYPGGFEILGMHKKKLYVAEYESTGTNIIVIDVDDPFDPVFETNLTYWLDSDRKINYMQGDGDKIYFLWISCGIFWPDGVEGPCWLDSLFCMQADGTIEEIDISMYPGLYHGYPGHDIPIYDDIAYLTRWEKGPVIALDLAHRPHPAIVGPLNKINSALSNNFVVSGNVAYSVDVDNGMLILPLPTRLNILSVDSTGDLQVQIPPMPMPGSYTVSAYDGINTVELRSAIGIQPDPSPGDGNGNGSDPSPNNGDDDGDGSSSDSGCFVQAVFEHLN